MGKKGAKMTGIAAGFAAAVVQDMAPLGDVCIGGCPGEQNEEMMDGRVPVSTRYPAVRA